MKTYILFGPPGAGKGTHAGAIAEKYNLKHISTGALLREEIAAGTELGKQAKTLIDAGELVPDAVVEGMIENAYDTVKGVDGFLLDGFPRNLAQAADLDAILAKKGEAVTAVVALMIPDELIYTRIQGRALIEGRADDANDEIITNMKDIAHRSLISDSIDEVELKTGERTEGISFSMQNFVSKLTSAVSKFIQGYFLKWLGFNEKATDAAGNILEGTAAIRAQDPGGRFLKYRWHQFILGPVIGSVLYLVVILFLRDDRSHTKEVEAQLKEKRAATEAAVAEASAAEAE